MILKNFSKGKRYSLKNYLENFCISHIRIEIWSKKSSRQRLHFFNVN